MNKQNELLFPCKNLEKRIKCGSSRDSLIEKSYLYNLPTLSLNLIFSWFISYYLLAYMATYVASDRKILGVERWFTKTDEKKQKK